MPDRTSTLNMGVQDPLYEAISILTVAADELRNAHTIAPDDWTGEPEAKAEYDRTLRVVSALSALRAPVAELQWSGVAEPNEQIRYTHVLADSPLGRFSIEWKSWKARDSFCVYLDGDYLDTSMDLDGAKAVALKKVSDMARALAVFAALASAPVAGEANMPPGYRVKAVEGHGYRITAPSGSDWVAHSDTPAGDLIAALLAAPQASEAVKPACHVGHANFTPFYLLANLRRICTPALARRENWVLAIELFAVGGTTARRICREAGIDPDGKTVARAALSAQPGAHTTNNDGGK
ncbi:hypothetical protein [Achromobacter anxifer]|uniref:hypothetical protein n=1 Tax=Achromobacter anxifer TaxID=1287737 RepID=UPI0021583A32|nr:hypothetical protein [Achromobacter anxifer]